MQEKLNRVIFYIDGFNLYYGLVAKGLSRYKWLDIRVLANKLLKPNQKLVEVNYFTSRVRNSPDKEKRQNTYLEALEHHSKINIFYGKYQLNYIKCYNCNHTYSSPNEKMTDVNIAVKMLIDAFDNKFDTGILISGDSDLIPPIREIHKKFKNKKIVVGFPPRRHNISMAQISRGNFIIGRKRIKDSQLPNEITKPDGYKLVKPEEWE